MSQRIKLDEFSFDISLEDFESELMHGGFDNESQIRVLSYNAFPCLMLEDEILGKSTYLQSLAMLSQKNRCILFCGITSCVQSIKHISIAVFHSGSLIDIVDRTLFNAYDGFEGGDKIKIFSTDYGRIGLIIDKDILFLNNWQKTVPNCDCVLSIVKSSDMELINNALLLSSQFSVPFLLVSNNDISWKEKPIAFDS